MSQKFARTITGVVRPPIEKIVDGVSDFTGDGSQFVSGPLGLLPTSSVTNFKLGLNRTSYDVEAGLNPENRYMMAHHKVSSTPIHLRRLSQDTIGSVVTGFFSPYNQEPYYISTTSGSGGLGWEDIPGYEGSSLTGSFIKTNIDPDNSRQIVINPAFYDVTFPIFSEKIRRGLWVPWKPTRPRPIKRIRVKSVRWPRSYFWWPPKPKKKPQRQRLNWDDQVIDPYAYVASSFTAVYAVNADQHPLNIIPSTAKMDLVNGFYDKVNQSTFNGLVFMAEFEKTVKMVVLALLRLVKSFYHLTHGRFKQAWRELTNVAHPNWRNWKDHANDSPPIEKISSFWLEFQFGWKPLIMDIESGIAALHSNRFKFGAQRYRKRKKYEKNIRDHKVNASNVFTHDGFYNDSSSDFTVTIGSIDITVMHQLVGYIEPDWSALETFGLSDFRSTAWELVPFSFVIDWFFNVGDWLKAIHTIDKLKGTFVFTETVKMKASGMRVESKVYSQSAVNLSSMDLTTGDTTYSSGIRKGPRWEGEASDYEAESTVMKRHVVFDINELYDGQYVMPDISSLTELKSLTHLLDSVALFGQRIKR